MKKINLICLGFFLSISSLIATTTETINLNFYEQVIIRQKDGESYSYQSSGGIGKDTIPEYPLSTFIDRSVFKFDLSDIDDHAVINSVTVYTDCSGSGYTFRLTKISSLSSDMSEIWNEIGAGTVLCSGLDYGYNVTNSDAFKTAIQNALVSDELIVGALSESETTIGSASDVYIRLVAEYTVPLLNLQAKNDLYGENGGNIGVGVNDGAVSYPSPYSFTAYEGDMLSLEAYDNQTINNKVWFFNDQEYPIHLSSWKKRIGEQETRITNAQSFITGNLTEDDNDAEFIAYLHNTSHTTSGTLTSNESWLLTNVNLTGNVTIPAGVTLTVGPDIKVNLNGYRINVNGTLNVDNDARIVPSFCLENTAGGQKTYYPSLSAAIAAVDEPWYKLTVNDTCLLSHDVSISGHSFEIGPKADIDLNGHNLTIDWVNNGNLTGVSASAQINPDLRLLAPNETILGFYGSLSDAFSDGSLVELRDTLTAAGNLSVPSGKTLKTMNNSVLKFNPGVGFYINGTLTANHTFFMRESGTWSGIHFQSGSSGIVNYCWIDNCTYGINLSNASPTIQDNIIENTTYAIRAVNGSNPLIIDNYIFENSYGI